MSIPLLEYLLNLTEIIQDKFPINSLCLHLQSSPDIEKYSYLFPSVLPRLIIFTLTC